jgi:hypothetical protein
MSSIQKPYATIVFAIIIQHQLVNQKIGVKLGTGNRATSNYLNLLRIPVE